MVKTLLATSALVLFSAGMGFAQDGASEGILPEFLTPDREILAQNDCVRVEPGVGEFQPSDQSDSPTPDIVTTECPEGMMPRDRMATGAIEEDRTVVPGVGQFEPSDSSDEPAPDIVE